MRGGYMTREKFEKDVANHTMTVLRDDGVYRHLRCAGDPAWCQWFEILTWPGRLCITGDMGAFVFTRLPDMFEFFRRNDGSINADYWAEKVEAVDRHGSLSHWSEQRWRQIVDERITQFIEDGGLSTEKAEALREAAAVEIVDEEHDAIESAHDFEYDGRPIFFDMWEYDCQEWSPRFIWCLYAIVWAIGKYDALKTAPGAV